MSHVSFSALKIWNDCPFRYKLVYEDKVGKFTGSEYTAFGTALHEAVELKIQDESVNEQEIFSSKFESEIAILNEQQVKYDEKLVESMKLQGSLLTQEIIPAFRAQFGNFKVLAAEEDILETIKEVPELNYQFKGFIDLILQTEDGKIHIIDHKSCSFGWKADKKSDPMTNYQLTFYKHFYAQKHGVEPKKIETYFALFKRTAKKNKVEIFRVTSGPKKTQNAINFLKKALYNINKKFFPKNKLNCNFCEFKNTEHCP